MEILARGVGRRKEAVAQVQIVKGSGQFLINNMPAQQYLHNNTCAIISLKSPLSVLNTTTTYSDNNVPTKEKVESNNSVEVKLEKSNELSSHTSDNSNYSETLDTIVKVKGGGLIGQAEAIKLGLARALCSLPNEISNLTNEEIRKQLKDKGYLTQDSRVKERRKYGLKKARKATQYNKR